MLLKDKMLDMGKKFFRYRSYLPLILVSFLLLQRKHFHYPQGNHMPDLIYESLCLFVALFGLAVRVYAVGFSRSGTSGRNTQKQVADSLNTDGIYSIVRNPLYLGNFFIVVGISMLVHSYELLIINSLLFIAFYAPIVLAEEDFLLQTYKDNFFAYAERTPLIVPYLKLWQRPKLKFNFVRVLYREHDTFMGIIWGFFAIEILSDLVIRKKLIFDPVWTIIFIIALFIWVILKFLKKKLKIIDRAP